MFGVQSFGPLLTNQTQRLIQRSTIKPVVVNGENCDSPNYESWINHYHRVVDGMAGAKFMKDLKELIENSNLNVDIKSIHFKYRRKRKTWP